MKSRSTCRLRRAFTATGPTSALEGVRTPPVRTTRSLIPADVMVIELHQHLNGDSPLISGAQQLETRNPELGTATLERFITAGLVLGLAAEQQGDLFGLLTFSLALGLAIDPQRYESGAAGGPQEGLRFRFMGPAVGNRISAAAGVSVRLR